MSSPAQSSSNSTYLTDVSQAFGQSQGLQFTSTVLGRPFVPDPNSQTMLEHWIHELATLTKSDEALATEIRSLCESLLEEKQSAGKLSDESAGKLYETLQKLCTRSFICNGILQEAWSRSITKTRSGLTYPKVGSKFADNYDAVLQELKKSSPNHGDELDKIGRGYVNKHHLMLKSIYKDMQVLHGNLVHAGQGSASGGNSDLHKALHEVTALNGKLDYASMDPEVTKIIQATIEWFDKNVGSDNFQ